MEDVLEKQLKRTEKDVENHLMTCQNVFQGSFCLNTESANADRIKGESFLKSSRAGIIAINLIEGR